MAASWGSTFYLIKDLLDRIPVLDFLAVRFAMASLVLLLIAPRALGRLSPAKRAYYRLKPVLPRALIRQMRRAYDASVIKEFALRWPLEDRYAKFLWAVMAQALRILDCDALPFAQFWPDGKRVALVLTHDIETARGQEFVRAVADLEESLGFRSSFNFVPERYAPDTRLMDDLRARGFEIGVHGLRHDGLLFSSWKTFEQRAARINDALARFGASGIMGPMPNGHVRRGRLPARREAPCPRALPCCSCRVARGVRCRSSTPAIGSAGVGWPICPWCSPARTSRRWIPSW